MQLSFNCRYKVLSKIGEGSFADVLKCEEVKTGTLYACKRLKKLYMSSKQMNEIPEIIALKKMGYHSNLLHLVETAFEPIPGYVVLVFELCDMSLYDLLKNRKRGLQENQVRGYTYQMLRGLEFIHNSGIFHRDIKPENILLKGNVVKIADLGSVRAIHSSPPYTEYVSTRWYRSPECLLTTGFYGPKMDVWAVGCVFYELLTLKPLFPGSNEMDQISKIHSIIGVPNTRTMEKFRKYKSYNFEWAQSWGRMKCEVKKRSEHWGHGLHVNKPRENIASVSLPSFHKYHQGASGPYKLFSMLIRVSEDGRDVLKQMLMYDPDLRSSAHRTLEHRYFNPLRDDQMSPRKYPSYSDAGYARRSQSGTFSKEGSICSKESLRRRLIPKPVIVGDTKVMTKKSKIARKNEEADENHHNASFHLPMLAEKYLEKDVTDVSACKKNGKYNIGNQLTSAKQGIAPKQNKKLTLPKIDAEMGSVGKCHGCKKIKPAKELENWKNHRTHSTTRNYLNGSVEASNTSTSSILPKLNIQPSPRTYTSKYRFPEANKKLSQIGTRSLGGVVKTKSPKMLSKLI
ncbi:MAPK/MAK/MRK overlapping kinase-like isoform X2 [Ischnura elegans]|uniref:MAPK/MAK/MRK overlapping kinase-like isoform X2 n=1 Tax=Ischnura elegans TaxID=197161 RepID=UPI001ED8B6CF|nr:MAPK/MAK/MRK overlapping kinase-like isoform X2 [Ischnura elegans]